VVLTLFASQDAWTDAAHWMQNKGADARLHVRSSAPVRRALVEIDLSPIPPGTCVSAAVLDLNVTNTGAASRTYEARALSAAWTAAAVTWQGRERGVLWSSAGGDLGSATALAPIGGSNVGVMTWDVTSDVAAILAREAPNNGWIIKDRSEGSGAVEYQFAALAGTNMAARPRLLVTVAACP